MKDEVRKILEQVFGDSDLEKLMSSLDKEERSKIEAYVSQFVQDVYEPIKLIAEKTSARK